MKKNEYDKIEDVIFIHKLKHGLVAIKWSLRMVLSGDFGEISDEQKKIIEKSLEENEKLILLANNLMSGADIKKNRDALEKDLCDLKTIIDSIVKSYETKIAEKKIKFDFVKPDNNTEAFLDKEKIKIAVQNILDNAIRYSRNNGEITISLNKSQNNLELKIQDSGIGIPENQKEKMFTKFFRASNASKLDRDGSGLGLFIAKNIIEAHRGKIWFESEEDQGSAFYISLPIK
jgi:signal transduction histidine kinase